MKNLIKLLSFIFFTSFIAQCQQSAELTKADLIFELKTKLKNDSDFKQLTFNQKDYADKIGTGYFNESEVTAKYIETNMQRVKNGEEKTVYVEAGMKHVDEYLQFEKTHLHYFKILLERYRPYFDKFGSKEYYTIFNEAKFELTDPFSQD
jgi:predicted ATPase